MPRKHKNTRLLIPLIANSGLEADKIDEWIKLTTHIGYFRRKDHAGGLAGIPFVDNPQYDRNGRLHTFHDVPFEYLIEGLEKFIEKEVQSDKRTSIWDACVEQFPKHQRVPKWDTPKPNPNEDPATPWSKSRAEAENLKSNEQVIRNMVAVVGSDDPERTFKNVAGQITWWDSVSGILTVGPMKVTSGRLGRDHQLDDVPNHYVRDMALHYVLAFKPDLAMEKKLYETVFPDLSVADIKDYVAAVKEKYGDPYRPTVERITPVPREIPFPDYLPPNGEDPDSYFREKEIPICLRNYAQWMPIHAGVSDPWSDMEPEFLKMYPSGPTEIRWDCDQVRLLINGLLEYTDWHEMGFLRVLPKVDHDQLGRFLDKKGPKNGVQMKAYHYAWEFFKKRQILGLPFPFPQCIKRAEKAASGEDALLHDTEGRNAAEEKGVGEETVEKANQKSGGKGSKTVGKKRKRGVLGDVDANVTRGRGMKRAKSKVPVTA